MPCSVCHVIFGDSFIIIIISDYFKYLRFGREKLLLNQFEIHISFFCQFVITNVNEIQIKSGSYLSYT